MQGDALAPFQLHRLLVEKYRFIFVTEDQRNLATLNWRDRRVLIRATGELGIVRDITVDASTTKIRVEVTVLNAETNNQDDETVDGGDAASVSSEISSGTMADGAVEVFDAQELVCWDEFGITDSITVKHPHMGSELVNTALLKRLFASGGNSTYIEEVEFLKTIDPQGLVAVSRVTFDVAYDLTAPAKAMVQLQDQ